jgi:hypothetical protein
VPSFSPQKTARLNQGGLGENCPSRKKSTRQTSPHFALRVNSEFPSDHPNRSASSTITALQAATNSGSSSSARTISPWGFDGIDSGRSVHKTYALPIARPATMAMADHWPMSLSHIPICLTLRDPKREILHPPSKELTISANKEQRSSFVVKSRRPAFRPITFAPERSEPQFRLAVNGLSRAFTDAISSR